MPRPGSEDSVVLRKIWDFCGEVRVNFWLLLLISLNLGIGSYYLKFNYALFNPLNHLLIQEWIQKAGPINPAQVWWLATLLLLLAFLGTNTLVCALKRLIQLWPFRRQLGLKSFSIRISPSFIHLCFLAILGGHLISLIVGFNGMIPARAGKVADLPGGGRVLVLQGSCERYPGPGPLQGRIKQCSAVLQLDSDGRSEVRELRVMQPVSWGETNFHLDLGRGSGPGPDLKIVIKQDPGRRFIFWGFAVLIVFMLWYFPQRKST
jgi:hypothetical protein